MAELTLRIVKGEKPQLLIDGVDLASICHGFRLEIAPGDMARVTLHCYVHNVEVTGGVKGEVVLTNLLTPEAEPCTLRLRTVEDEEAK